MSSTIHLLADQGDKSGVAQCIAQGSNVNESDTSGQKPLHYAAAKGEVVALLLQHSADPNSKSERGVTPLHEAAKAGKLETVVLLLENKAEPNSADNDNKNPLHYATAHGHVKVVAKLLEHGAEINNAAKDGTTPLHLAATKGSLPLLTQLMEKGARVDARDLRGNTALASVPLADRPSAEAPAAAHRLVSDIKGMYTAANEKKSGYNEYDDEPNTGRRFCDATFNVDGQQIYGHRNIISLRCPRLGKMFKPQAASDEVEIRDVPITIFQSIMEWIYSEEVASLRASDPDVSAVLSLILAADRFGLRDLKSQCESLAIRNISTANLAAVWAEVRKCTHAAPALHAHVAHLIFRNWNVLVSSKMEIVALCNVLTVGEVKEEPTPEPAHPKAATSTSTSSSTPHPPRGQSPSRQRKASHAPPAETPSRTQPERGARHATPSAPVPTVVPPTLPEEITAAQIGNNNFYVATDCRLDGKNLKNAKGLHGYLFKHKHAYPFVEPVDPQKFNIPNYFDIIKRPMDLGTIKTKLDNDNYGIVNEFAADMRLVFCNALIFNSPGYEIYKMSEQLLKVFNTKFESIQWERASANGEHHASPAATPTTTPVQKQKRKSSSTPRQATPSAPAAHPSNGHREGSPSPSPPPSPAPVKAEPPPPRKVAPPPPPPREEDYEMSFEDKRILGAKMDELLPEQLTHVIQILGAKTQNDDDIEIDMNDVSNENLRKLEKYVNECLEQNRLEQLRQKRRKDIDDEDIVVDDQDPEDSYNPSEKKKKSKKQKRSEDDY